MSAQGAAAQVLWKGPLANTVTVHAKNVTIADALELLAKSSRVRITYSTEFVPASRKVSIDYNKLPLGEALRALLHDVAVQSIAVSTDQVALAPGIPAVNMDTPTEPIFPLQAIVARADASTIVTTRQPSMSIAYVGTREIDAQGSIASVLNVTVPGVWSWQTPMGFTAQYSVRGASSFGATSPKVYIDGIEVANPLLVTMLPQENIDHIEVVRGPQGAALYGADAINGVTNIVTKHGPLDPVGPHVRVKSGLALSQTDFMASNSALGQDHTVTVQAGSAKNSALINAGYGRSGEYVPGAYTNHVNFDGSGRMVTGDAILTATGRFASQSSLNPGGLRVDSIFSGVSPLSMKQYTLGVRGVLSQGLHLTHALVAGIDGYNLNGEAADSMAPRSVTDSILRAAGDDGWRTTLRASSVARYDLPHQTSMSLTLAAEHSRLHQSGSGADITSYGEWMTARTSLMLDPDSSRNHGHGRGGLEQELPEYAESPTFSQSRTARSVSSQLDASWHDKLFVNAGVRFENDVVNSTAGGTTSMPMVGGAYVIGNDVSNIKLRASYGKGVRWPDLSRGGFNVHSRVGALSLSPETQSGVEYGADAFIGGVATLQVTRYDQTASGLVQSVALVQNGKMVYALQNVGEIENTGWEMQGTLHSGRFALGSTLSLTNSRVAQVANGYTGDLRAGDRMLGVPSRTMTVDGSYTGGGWMGLVSVARAFNWINYDRARLIAQPTPVWGGNLRSFWLRYNGFTHVRATVSRDLPHGFGLTLIGDNLLNKQLGEPDNVTVVPGRTFSLGVRASF